MRGQGQTCVDVLWDCKKAKQIERNTNSIQQGGDGGDGVERWHNRVSGGVRG